MSLRIQISEEILSAFGLKGYYCQNILQIHNSEINRKSNTFYNNLMRLRYLDHFTKTYFLDKTSKGGDVNILYM